MLATDLATRYAQCLYLSLAKEEVVTVEEEVQGLLAACQQQPLLVAYLESPLHAKQKKIQLLNQLFKGKLADTLVNFLCFIVHKKRIACLLPILTTFQAYCKSQKAIQTIIVKTATTLTAAQQKRFEKLATRLANDQPIALLLQVDPALIGGWTLQIEDYLLDQSLRSNLKGLGKHWGQSRL